jgi:hypothetical protein
VRAAPNPPSLVADSNGEADKRRCRVEEQVADWFSLAGVAQSRGKQKRCAAASLWKQRGQKREEVGADVGTPHVEEEEGESGRREGRRGLDGAPT